MIQKEIKLKSRSNNFSILEFYKKKNDCLWYLLKCNSYYRVIYSNNPVPKIEAIDPDGGPFMNIGDKTIIEGYEIFEIRNIKDGICLIFKTVN